MGGSQVVLILLTGPIASGKSTVAGALGDRLRTAGRSVAVIDLDDLVLSIGGWRDLSWERFDQSFDVFGHLVSAWLSKGLDVVAHGPLFEKNAMEAVLRGVPAEVPTFRVLLLTTYEVALQRVAGDPERDLSKDAERLRASYERAMPMLEALPPADWTFDTTNTDLVCIVDQLIAGLIGDSESRARTPPSGDQRDV
jgi:hypothetical protein